MRPGWVIKLVRSTNRGQEDLWNVDIVDPSGRRFGFATTSQVADLVLRDKDCPRNFGMPGHMRLPRDVIDLAREALRVYEVMGT